LIASMTSGLSKKYWQPGFVCIILHKRLTKVAGLFLMFVVVVMTAIRIISL
jgi:hypothetical protein